jgi:hypothetical protein
VSLADFQAGFWRAVINRAEANGIALSDLPSAFVANVNTKLSTFYGNNTATIEGAPGIPGVPMSTSWQAGFELGLLVQRCKASANQGDWGSQLTTRILQTGRNERRIRIRRDANGTVIAEEVDG